jgi:hypothetical protein
VNLRHAALWIDVLLIDYRGRPAAWICVGRAELFPSVAALEADHPIRRWVTCLAIFALDVEGGRIRGPFTQPRADHFARCALLPDEEFAPLAGHDDVTLAEHFNVPLEQVAEKRMDLVAIGLHGERGA